MIKKTINQNDKYVKILKNFIEPYFIFSNNPINRVKKTENIYQNKNDLLKNLKKKIDTIENCNLKNYSKNLILGNGNIDSPLMLIGEAPGKMEDDTGLLFQGEVGDLLNKMLLAINIKREDIYLTYSVNFRPPEDRKPTAQEVKRYSIFLKEHISIINPEILFILGSTAMEAITGTNNKVSNERGQWKEIILKNKTFPFIISFNPSYLIRFPENKKFSWDDLKKLKKKIQELNIKI